MNLNQRISNYLKKRQKAGNYRTLTPETGLVDFCSNDYLGFAYSGVLDQALKDAPKGKHPKSGSTGSRLISGNFWSTELTEQKIALFHQAEAALMYNSGYVANVGFFSCVPRPGDTILYDELIHASVHDGMKMGRATCLSFLHNDIEDLRSKLAKMEGLSFVAVESIYSMDGDEAKLVEIAAVCKEFGAHLVVDEAHATGVVGPNGAGLVQHYKLEEACFARIHTFGKAMGCHGAVIIGSQLLKNYLINFSRPFIYTTALPPDAVKMIGVSYGLLTIEKKAKTQLHEIISFFLQEISMTPWSTHLIPSKSAIQSILIPDNQKAKSLAQKLRKKGLDLRPILYPTVAKGRERIRICLHAHNTFMEIRQLIELLNQL